MTTLFDDHVPQTAFGEILAGGRKMHVIAAFLISAVITAIVVTPMAVKANGHVPLVNGVAASPEQIWVDTAAAEAGPLQDQTVNGNILISFANEDAAAVSFAVAPKNEATVLERMDGAGPTFDLYSDSQGRATPLDTTDLPDGDYEIFVVVTTRSSEVQQTRAEFSVQNELPS